MKVLQPIPETARDCGVSYLTLWRGVTAGQVAAIKSNGQWLVERCDAEQWAQQRKAGGR